MTNKHFEAFAEDFKGALELLPNFEPSPMFRRAAKVAILRQIDSFCAIATKFNPSFNPTAFKKACGL